MLSLIVIFINVVVGSNDIPSDYEHSITVVLIFLNVIVVMIVVGELMFAIALHIKPVEKLKVLYRIFFRKRPV